MYCCPDCANPVDYIVKVITTN
uniref:Uncharacterized protein n=1 Tax=Anguilla anguilla TaxID=7936 RepID=A0A0E9SP14_ANGAN